MRLALIQQAASHDRAANLRLGIENARAAASQGAKLISFESLLMIF